MGNKQGCLISLFFVLVITNLVGLYYIIDSHSRFTQAMAQNTEQLASLQGELNRLASGGRMAVRGGDVASSQGGADTDKVADGGNGQGAFAGFANSEFRQPQAEFGGRKAFNVQTFSGNLNSIVRNEATTSYVWSICNDDLAVRNKMRPLEFEPQLAQSWEISEDGLTYTIHLRRGVMWHPFVDPVTKKKIPAKEMTSDDYLFYWETVQNKDLPLDHIRVYFKDVKELTVIDRYTFRVIWANPYFKSLEMTLGLTALPRHYYRPDPGWDDKEYAAQMRTSVRNQFVIGNGPYRFVEWKKGEGIRFVRFKDYYGPRPYSDEIILREIPDPSVALVELKKGGIDQLGLSPEQWVKESKEPEFKVVTPEIKTAVEDSLKWSELKESGKTPDDYRFEKYQYETASMAWYYIGYNLKNKLFADKRVRQALTMLTDRERILKDVYYGFGKIMAGPFTPNSPYCDPEVKPFAFDPQKAKELLVEAGWTDTDKDGILEKDLDGDGKAENFSYSLMIASTSENARKFSAIIQADMKKAGIDMKIQPLEWSVMIERLNGRAYDACTLGWTGTLESDPYQIWHGSQADLKESSNHVSFKNAEADKLIELGRKTLDPQKRTEIFRGFYRIVHEEQPYTFLLAPVSLRTQSKRFNNSRVYTLGMDDSFEWVAKALQIK